MAKGIRVNALAKELGVESKVLLEKCRQEGLADKVPNHQSTIAIGLAETIREWHRNGDLAALMALHKPESAESAARKKVPPKSSKKKANGEDDVTSHDSDTATAVAEPEPIITAEITDAPAHVNHHTSAPAHVEKKIVTVETPSVVHADVPAPIAPTPVAEVAVVVPAPVVAETPIVKDVPPPDALPAGDAPVAPIPPVGPAVVSPKSVQGQHRPTVKLDNRPPALVKPERPKAAPSPAFVPAPAALQGPKVVREEKPDVVSTPRKRQTSQTTQPAVVMGSQARAGRGVKSTEDDEGESDGPKKAAGKGRGTALSARRRGPDGRRGEADEKLKEFSEQDLKDRSDRLLAASASRQATDLHLKKTEARGTHIQAKTAAQVGGAIEIEEPITVRSLSTAIGLKSNEIIAKLMKQGVFANINQVLDFDTAQMLAFQYNIELKIVTQPTMEEALMAEFDARSAAATNLQPRPTIVTILGHVDHGKTSLLDKIRKANVAAGEAGGITQHIAAWTVQVGDKRVTFIDTPGHQAFTAMRARGANMTDVIVLVVSAAEGVQPQTIESINHAKAAGVPLIVAMNKIDRADANPDMVLGQLAGAGLNPTEWGGDTEVVRTSAITGQGIPDLIEMLDYQSQLRDLKADPTIPARGSVIEARIDPGLGAIATCLVQEGTLKVGDVVLAGQGWGRVRSLLDDHLKPIKFAGPSTPVIISGLSKLPSAGDKFYAMSDLERAESIAEERFALSKVHQQAAIQRVSLESIYGQMKDSSIKTINLIIKADVQGSIETLMKTVTDQNTDEVRVKIIHAAAGAISESDVELADASTAVIIGFHVVPDEAARKMAEERRIEIRTYRVIYEIFDDLKKALSGMLTPEIREKHHGTVEIRQIFKVSRLGNIAGCFVTEGHIQRGSKIRLLRDGKIITEDLTIDTLKRVKDDVKEVKQGFECGIKLAGYDDIKIGDKLDAYIRETFQRTL